ncbi:MAG: carboxyltransferase domain-containing protein, partial [Propionibacteriaceae bacterium]|nr:carboxyltransferase domain-containing protein [Propionibacteriaceae bacterium]
MADDRRVLPMGDRAWLVELPDLDDALRLFASLTAAHLPGVVEAVPAARTVLVKFDPLTTTADELGTRLASLPAAPGAAASGRLVTIAVLYDGDDLAE